MLSYCGNNIDAIIGDFNYNHFDQIPDYLEEVFLNYKQIVTKPTQISGGLLDPIYIHKSVTFSKRNLIKHLYFSDHDATFCLFENQ